MRRELKILETLPILYFSRSCGTVPGEEHDDRNVSEFSEWDDEF
jgi:hypothetical protein